ncbi:MAG: flagellar protein FlgN [Anaerolineales bacterium]|nr:flagellar protein FlgN [Anaerolineales bacterium]
MTLLTTPIVDTLHHNLVNEVEDYRQLLSLTQCEQIALQSGNLTDLTATTEAKISLLQRLADWEKKRQQIMAKLAEKLKLPAPPSLSELIAFCDETVAEKLATLRQEFINLTEQVYLLNQGNQLLLQTELVRVNATVNYLLSGTSAGVGYTTNGISAHLTPPSSAGNVFNWQV